MSNTTVTQSAAPVVNTTVKVDFGNGRYSALMRECYKDAQVIFSIDAERAEVLARRIASDVGAVMASAKVEVKAGKSINKDGQLTLSEAAKLKAVHCTDAIFCLRAMQWANDCGKFGFIRSESKFQLSSDMLERIAAMK